jgi:hypothetical protein
MWTRFIHFVLLIWAFSPQLLSVYFHPKALPLGLISLAFQAAFFVTK